MSEQTTKTEESYLVPENAAWYVKHGLGRAIEYTQDAINRMRKLLANPNTPEILYDEYQGMIAYHEQWLREAKSAYSTLPAQLQPYNAKTPKSTAKE